MTHHTETGSLEDDVDRSRARLRDSFDALQDRVGVEFLAQEALGLLRHNAADYARVIGRAARDNPLAVALTGAGIAWLIFGGAGKSKPAKNEAATAPGAAEAPGSAAAKPDTAAQDDDDCWSARIDALREAASEALRELERAARDSSDDLRDVAAERAQLLARFAEGMQASLTDGLDGLEAAARDRIVAAREAAYAARLRIETSARSGTRDAERLIREHPMVAGVLALALGAALVSALPRRHSAPAEKPAPASDDAALMAAAADLLREARARVS